VPSAAWWKRPCVSRRSAFVPPVGCRTTGISSYGRNTTAVFPGSCNAWPPCTPSGANAPSFASLADTCIRAASSGATGAAIRPASSRPPSKGTAMTCQYTHLAQYMRLSRLARPFSPLVPPCFAICRLPPWPGRCPDCPPNWLPRDSAAPRRSIVSTSSRATTRSVYAVLSALPRGRFCEWGSGIGVVTGIAQTLGFDACGIEIHPPLAAASRKLLADFELAPTITTGDYLQLDCPAEIYFAYCWPGQMPQVEGRFAVIAPDHARLLICHGAEDIRCRVKEEWSFQER
jgi:hypothetical protein